jgi:hypothetical protein
VISNRQNDRQPAASIRFWAFLGVFLVTVPGRAGETVTVTDVAGVKSTGTLKTWSPGKLLITSPSHEFFEHEIRSITFERPLNKVAHGSSMVWLSNGDRISARAVAVANDSLAVTWPVLGDVAMLAIPLEKVTAVIFEMPATVPQRLRLLADLETLPPGSDAILLTNGDRSLGELEQLDAAFLVLKTATSSLKLDRSRILAIRLNPELTNVKRSSGRRTVLTLIDGSRVTSTNADLTDESLILKSPGLGTVTIPLSTVVSCHRFGDRVIPITDYEPEKVEFTPYLSTSWRLVQNANVQHGPLMLRGNEFITGLGTHSRMAITYKLLGNEREFQGLVGIDDIANGAGSAVFAIELDGRRVWTSPELTGKSAAASVPKTDLRDAKRLTLLVDFGQFADVSDYADWCDAVLITDQPR